MKRKISIIIICCCVNFLGCVNNEKYKYRCGKDTVVAVGDGRFQILKGLEEYSLYDSKQDEFLLDNVNNYYDEGERLYVSNDEKYLIIDYKESTYNMYFEDELNQKDYIIFKSDEMTELVRNIPTNTNETEYRND